MATHPYSTTLTDAEWELIQPLLPAEAHTGRPRTHHLLPPRYQLGYDEKSARKFFVCLVTVIWKLGQSEPMQPSCVAEELAAHILIEEAKALLKYEGIKAEFDDFEDTFFEDLDFQYLYVNAYEGIEEVDIAQELGITYLAFRDWFTRFGRPDNSDYTAVHPVACDGQETDTASLI